MAKVRVFQLARDLNIASQDILDRLKDLGVEARTASSSVDEETADKLKRAVKIDALTTRKKRIYGSEEDDADRDSQAKAQADRVAAERAARKKAGEEAKKAAAERKKGGHRRARQAPEPPPTPELPPALAHAPGAPRLRKTPSPPPVAPDAEASEAVAGEAAVAAATPATEAPAAAPVSVSVPAPPPESIAAKPTPRATPLPRPAGPLRPIAPPAAPAPPVAAATTGASGPPVSRPPLPGIPRPSLPGVGRPPVGRPLRPIAPPRPVGPHPTTARPNPVVRSPMPPGRSPFPARPGGPPRPRHKRRGHRPPILAPQREERPVYTGPPREITLTEGITVKHLGEKMADVKSRDIIKTLIGRGIMATVNQVVEPDLAVEICKEFGYEASFQTFEEEVAEEQKVEDKPENLHPRAPVVTVMGHVDHGKTSLLDAIRQTNVAEGEAGGITQHIGAYHVDVGDRKVVFLDTPGHEAFTLMRARGAKVTDIVILVVAADDGVMPQTVEAMDHAKAADVPIIVAVNKIDKPNAQPDRVKQQLSDRGLMPEEWGGTAVFVNVSAKQKQNLEQLLEMVLLVADLQELKANPDKPATGTVLEARLDKGRGPVAHIVVQDGQVKPGDTVVAGAVTGKVRALVDEHGQRLQHAGPSTPVEVLGLQAVPEPGDNFLVVTDAQKAQSIVSFRQLKLREKAMRSTSMIKLEDLSTAIADGQMKELPLVVKADVQGSVEALCDQLMKIPQEKIKLRIIRSGAGAISEDDVLLAAASNAIVIGFNVRPVRQASDTATRELVELRLYTVIYNAIDDIKKAMEGMLEPTEREVALGRAEVRQIFRVSRLGTIAGCYVTEGVVTRSARVRLLRDNVVKHTGKVSSLRRFKDDASEVKSGFECGIGLEAYNDIKPEDVIEFFTTEKVKETLE